MSENSVKNSYQGIFLTETVMGNPNGDFIDNSPRNFDGVVFTTDKCIKYNIRKYIHDNYENLEEKKDIVFFFPRPVENSAIDESKFKTRDAIYDDIFNKNFDDLKKNSVDVRMFGGTFSFSSNNKQIYGPIQLSYGIDINDAQIKKLQINAPFATTDGKQTTNGTESVVDDAIIAYDISINPNNYPGLLLNSDLDLFKKSLWFGTNLRKSTSKKTESKLLMLIKYVDNETLNIGELKSLISIANKKSRKMGEGVIELDCTKLSNKINNFGEFIEDILIISDEDEIILTGLDFDENKIKCIKPNELLKS